MTYLLIIFTQKGIKKQMVNQKFSLSSHWEIMLRSDVLKMHL